MDWQLIESDEALQKKLLEVAHCDVVMVDTEFMRRDTFFPQIALLQLCFVSHEETTAWLIDPLCISDVSPLAELLENPQVLKVLHSASEDLEVFHRWLGVLPQPLFDTQRAASLLDRGFGLGYRALVQTICDVDLPKGETRSNWLQRPLTTSQCDYAGLDVTWLLSVWRDLHAQCERDGKLEWVLADGLDAVNALASTQTGTHKRVKTAWKLNSRELGILIAVCDWREQTARDRDKPRGWIIDDKACLQLAQFDPKSADELEATVEIPAGALSRYTDPLLEVLAAQREVSAEQLPPPMPGPLDASQRDKLKKLKRRAKEIAVQLTIAPEVALPSKDYELLLREADTPGFKAPGSWRGWREDNVLVPLRHFLATGK